MREEVLRISEFVLAAREYSKRRSRKTAWRCRTDWYGNFFVLECCRVQRNMLSFFWERCNVCEKEKYVGFGQKATLKMARSRDKYEGEGEFETPAALTPGSTFVMI